MGLFEPVWKTRLFRTEKEKKAVAYVRKLSDPQKLVRIALEAPSLDVRGAAVEGLMDEKLLRDVALGTDSYILADAVIAKIRDPGLLQELALRGTDRIPFEKLMKKIPKSFALAEIAHQAVSMEARVAAVRELKDLTLLLDLVFSQEPAIRHAAQESFQALRAGGGSQERGEKVLISKEQFGRYIDALIAEDDPGYLVSLPTDTDCEELYRLYRNASRENLRAKAFAQLVCCCPAEELVELYKAECTKVRWADDPALPYWKEGSFNLVNRVMNEEKSSISLLLRFVEDPDVGYEMGARCIRLLFAEELENVPDIRQLRSAGIDTYLGNIPHWTETCRHLNAEGMEKAAIRTLGITLPESVRVQFGFEVETHDSSGEDQFGRYTSSWTEVTYKGKTY